MHQNLKQSASWAFGPLAQQLKTDFPSVDYTESKNIYYVCTEQAWPELEGPQTGRICLLSVYMSHTNPLVLFGVMQLTYKQTDKQTGKQSKCWQKQNLLSLVEVIRADVNK